MGATVTPIPFVDDRFPITIIECSNDCTKFINRTVTLREFAAFCNDAVNVFEVVSCNSMEYRFESHHGQWVQGE